MTATLVFLGDSGRAEVTLAGGAELRIVGRALSAGGPVLATLVDGSWCIGSARFTSITCSGPVRVDFRAKAGTRHYGPFADLTIRGAAVLDGQVELASFDVINEVWRFDTEQETESLLIRPIQPPVRALGIG